MDFYFVRKYKGFLKTYEENFLLTHSSKLLFNPRTDNDLGGVRRNWLNLRLTCAHILFLLQNLMTSHFFPSSIKKLAVFVKNSQNVFFSVF